ncbi:Asp-tRNA(Asn)/Glu-tRNA(Gln) amidotransferase subunit GatC [Candidatus Gottesmanbacteria bacterium]|nr:Asp-tRNA(Asn)/Glu-tRNA(Gln) amidotransferase subunit GatC [Candidatus Gottesmanbacteria bacterium]
MEIVSKLQKIETKNVVPTSQVTGLTNVFREDVIETDRILTQSEALSNAKKTHNGYFVVPKILE